MACAVREQAAGLAALGGAAAAVGTIQFLKRAHQHEKIGKDLADEKVSLPLEPVEPLTAA
jgi:hypothetical protein